jgi:cold shock CspA family protein
MLTNMVKQVGILVLLMTVTLPGLAAAHGEGGHIFGTITALDTAEIQVLTTEGKTVSIRTVAGTKYRNKGSRGGGNVPKVGDRVAVDVTEKDGKLMATEVQFSSAAKQQKP